MIRLDAKSVVTDWRRAANYASLLACDRRAFAWEWLRRNAEYQHAWQSGKQNPGRFGLVAFADPQLGNSEARPIWAPETDPAVLRSAVSGYASRTEDHFDVRMLSRFVSVEVRDQSIEHWLLSDGQWSIRLDLHDGTLLGGPLLLEHVMQGMASAEPKLQALRQLIALSQHGELPVGLRPKEAKASRWVLELQTADALTSGATQQEIARVLFGRAIAEGRWRIESGSYRLRVQRLVRTARKNLGAPLAGPWFAS